MKSCAIATGGMVFSNCRGPENKSRRPNILFFLVDDQRDDTLGCAGFPVLQTPHIDALARNGIRFLNTFVTTSICAASRASILTGLYERTHGYTFGTLPLSRISCMNSYPLLLRKNGYRTGFIGKFGVKIESDQPQQLFDYFRPLDRNPYFKIQEDGSLRHTTELAGDYAVEFLKSQPQNEPFCLSVSFNAVHAEDSDKENHYPYPFAVKRLYEKRAMPLPRLSEDIFFPSQPDFLKGSLNRERFFWRWDTPEKYDKNMRSYLRMISGVDSVIGRIRKALETCKLGDNTIVIYSADNGYYMGDRGFAGKWSHYEESLRVPLIIYDPAFSRQEKGKEIDSIALNIDLAPTMLDFAGVAIPDIYQGRSLRPLFRHDQPLRWRTDFFCEHLMSHSKIPKWEGVHSQRYVYARYFEQDPVYEFLHDLERDPDQSKNFSDYPEYKTVLEKMRHRCTNYVNRYKGIITGDAKEDM
jgi:arylsulfatase A-like enzyme